MANGPDRHVEDVNYVCLPEFAIEQKELIDRLRHDVELIEASRGTLNAGAVRTIISMVSISAALVGAFAAMWFSYQNSADRLDINALQNSVNNLSVTMEKDEIKIEDINGTLSELVTETLRTEDVTQRLAALQVQITGQDGKFNRIVEGRLEPRMDRDQRRLDVIETRLNNHLLEEKE